MTANAYRVKYCAYCLNGKMYFTPDLSIDRAYWGEQLWETSKIEHRDMTLFQIFVGMPASTMDKEEDQTDYREHQQLTSGQRERMDLLMQLLGSRKLTLPELFSAIVAIRSDVRNARVPELHLDSNIGESRLKESHFRAWLEALQLLYLQNHIHIQPAIQRDSRGRLFCLRCLSSDNIEEHVCGACEEDRCYSCTNCLVYGEVRACTPMIEARSTENRRDRQGCSVDLSKSVRIVYPHPLTDEQQEVSQQIAEHVAQGRDCLVWAVCGAGKTELIFQAIGALLSDVSLDADDNTFRASGDALHVADDSLHAPDVSFDAAVPSVARKKVMLATPRKDVVFELLPRISKAFPDLTVHAVYGGSQEKHRAAEITIATTHQLLRYSDRAFDLVVIDETDAFPYAGDEELSMHAHRIGKQFIYMTATPDSRLLKQHLSVVTLFHRHHRQPLPEPVNLLFQGVEARGLDLLWQKIRKRSPLSSKLKNIIKQLPKSGVVMFFVPTIASGQRFAHLLRMYLQGEGERWQKPIQVTFVHAQDPEREQKITDLRAGRYQWIVTTTILERGVTIPDSHVIVIDAQHQVFTKSTLVQIAGRVGRTVEYPTGTVIFLSRYVSKQVVLAMEEIRALNQWGELQ